MLVHQQEKERLSRQQEAQGTSKDNFRAEVVDTIGQRQSGQCQHLHGDLKTGVREQSKNVNDLRSTVKIV